LRELEHGLLDSPLLEELEEWPVVPVLRHFFERIAAGLAEFEDIGFALMRGQNWGRERLTLRQIDNRNLIIEHTR